MSEWPNQYTQLLKSLDEIKEEVKENRNELQSLKQEFALGKGSIRAVLWLGAAVGAIWTIMKIMRIL